MNNRFTWIKIYGVLVHSWNWKLFEKLCINNGGLIHVDTVIEKKRLDIARCLVRTTTMENVNKVVLLVINSHVFNIKMEDEAFTCPIEF